MLVVVLAPLLFLLLLATLLLLAPSLLLFLAASLLLVIGHVFVVVNWQIFGYPCSVYNKRKLFCAAQNIFPLVSKMLLF